MKKSTKNELFDSILRESSNPTEMLEMLFELLKRVVLAAIPDDEVQQALDEWNEMMKYFQLMNEEMDKKLREFGDKWRKRASEV